MRARIRNSASTGRLFTSGDANVVCLWLGQKWQSGTAGNYPETVQNRGHPWYCQPNRRSVRPAMNLAMLEFPVSRLTAPLALRQTTNDVSTAAARLVDISRAMRQVRALATRAAAGDAKVFITGESGVGKDVVAQYIHAHSARASKPFIAVNCAAIADTLLETELFGHTRGSFTGAYRDRMGRLEAAHRGTIFLDEIAEMSLQMQAHLLRFLESGEIQPVGSAGGPVRVDVRIISATNRDLEQLVATGAFRSDLLYRIKVVHIHVPPLRERKEDLPTLIEAAATRTGRQIRFTESALQALSRYRWPGNVRELQNVIEQAAWMSESRTSTLLIFRRPSGWHQRTA